MLFAAVAALIAVSFALVVYHHAVYPLLLKALAGRPQPRRPVPRRGWLPAPSDQRLPRVAVLVPAFDEAAVIADKIRSLACLDYPADRLRAIVVCDGCTDDTARRARAAAAEPECRDLAVSIIEAPVNRGKVAILNDHLPAIDADVVLLTDASALVSVDALLVAADHFADSAVGVVCATYRLLRSGSVGEDLYWRVEVGIKRAEAAIGAPIGAHGACYAFRRSLFQPLPADTINDDFILPMRIVAAGHRAVYDERMVAVELEPSPPARDFRRRLRIAAGNVQQVTRLTGLLHPRHRGTAFCFASGKALRAAIPFLLLLCLVGSFALAWASPIFAAVFLGQVVFYALALLPQAMPELVWPTLVRGAGYLVIGHVAGFIGASRYLVGRARRPGGSCVAEHAASLHPGGRAGNDSRTHVHPSVRIGKRVFDVVASVTGLVVTLPVFPLVAAAIWLEDRGPVFYRQLRIGESRPDRTRLFMVIKFRSMRADAEAGGAVWAAEGDPRVTRVGRFLRRTRLDELPQLVNVLRGEMSLIGPRPERPGFFAGLDRQIPYYGERTYGVMPGITGFAQVHNRADRTLDDVRTKLYYDHAYALALSRPAAWLSLDLWIAARTLVVMCCGPDVLARRPPDCFDPP